jgi:hypothetical protein
MGKIRCPLRPASMLLDWDRPKILAPPGKPARLLRPADHHRPRGRGSQGQAETRLPVKSPPPVLHPPHRRRTRATAKDPAASDISRGWCRLMGLAPLMLLVTTLLIVRNQRILAGWNARPHTTARVRYRTITARQQQHARKPAQRSQNGTGHTAPGRAPESQTLREDLKGQLRVS